jgi:hypothetical protein
VVFSLHLRPYLMPLPRWRRMKHGYLTDDMSYAMFTPALPNRPSPEAPAAMRGSVISQATSFRDLDQMDGVQAWRALRCQTSSQ